MPHRFARLARPAPWVWDQHWRDVLFVHWQVPFAALRALVPEHLDIDTYDGAAWISLVLFRLRVRPRWLPFVPGLSDLVEVNLRTYVRADDRPGIWFLSVHADNRWAMRLARWLTPMPYVHAPLVYDATPERDRFMAECPAWSLAFRPVGGAAPASDGSVDGWLLERYTLFLQDRRERWLAADVQHAPWEVHDVELAFAEHGKIAGLEMRRTPDAVHFSAGVRARFGAFVLQTHQALGVV